MFIFKLFPKISNKIKKYIKVLYNIYLFVFTGFLE